MMGPTHVLGGVTALALYSVATNQVDHVPAWAYGLAAVSALVPDADNGRGSILNRPYLLPVKLLTYPIWMGQPAHRGRTHSILATIAYTALIVAYAIGLDRVAGIHTGLEIVATAAAVGYASHLALDIVNIPGVALLWPLPVKILFPPWRAKAFIPGRFETGTRWEWATFMTLVAVCGWHLIEHAPAIAGATKEDTTIRDLLGATTNGLVTLVAWFIEFLRGLS
jgi:membrane-bound metal-dependent hydrolase YbcI (DUF457 family)